MNITELIRYEKLCAFDQGYACAVANIKRLHGEEVIAADVLAQHKINMLVIDAYDREVIESLPKRGPRP
jgi:regulator of RNase E activity RraB